MTLRRKHRSLPQVIRDNRNDHVIDSIMKALKTPLPEEYCLNPHETQNPPPIYRRFHLRTFFRASKHIDLSRREPCLFLYLRRNVFDIPEDLYNQSFANGRLIPGGSLGFSGASFFFTTDKEYIIKSL